MKFISLVQDTAHVQIVRILKISACLYLLTETLKASVMLSSVFVLVPDWLSMPGNMEPSVSMGKVFQSCLQRGASLRAGMDTNEPGHLLALDYGP